MGSRSRFNYTMMGDDVNLAARLESGAKSWGAYTMCSEATRAACAQHGGDRVVFRPLGRIVVKGRTQPVAIHEIVGLKENLADGTRECLDLFAQALAHFQGIVPRDYAANETIGLGALVALDGPGRYFMGPRAGGTEIQLTSGSVLVITPQSPLGRQLLGRRQGDTVQLDVGGKLSTARINSVI